MEQEEKGIAAQPAFQTSPPIHCAALQVALFTRVWPQNVAFLSLLVAAPIQGPCSYL